MEVAKGIVCWTKSDIIPGVVLAGPREHPNINGFGYIYKESNKIAKSCTYTHKITDEEIDEEKQLIIDMKIENEKREAKISELKTTLPYICPLKYVTNACKGSGFYGKFGCYDLRNYYNTLKIKNEPITKQLIKSRRESFDENDIKPFKLCLCGLLCFSDYDICYVKVTDDVVTENNHNICNLPTKITDDITKHKTYLLHEFDVFCNISVHGASYAKLKCSDGEIDFDMDVSAVSDVASDVFRLTDMTLQNPLFKASSGDSLRILTDGSIIKYNGMNLQSDARRTMSGFSNAYALSWFDSKKILLMMGHMWQPSVLCNYDDIANVDIV